MRYSHKLISAALLAALASTPAMAHTGAAASGGMMAGLAHPMLGFDHLLAVLAVGIWSMLSRSNADGLVIWLPPLVFLGALAAGGIFAVSGIGLPAVEAGIALSVLVLGLMIIARFRLGAGTGLAIIAAFAVLHGYAHGSEASGSVPAFLAGVTLATGVLYLAGAGIGSFITNIRYAAPALGFTFAAAGVAIIAM